MNNATTPRTDAAVNAGGNQLLNIATCARELERELALSAKMLARQCDLAREAETTLALALDKDARKTKEYNLLVQENRALRATHAEHLERANKLWDQNRELFGTVAAMRTSHPQPDK